MDSSIIVAKDPNAPTGFIPLKLQTAASITTRAATAPPAETDDDRAAWASRLLGKAKKKAADPIALERANPFFWQSEISNDRIDSHFTRMTKRTLKSFVKDAKAGVSFQNSHDWRSLGLGQSIDGTFEDDLPDGDESGQKASNMRALADFYTVPGMKLNASVDTDSFILGVQSGVLRDVSVGFYAEKMTCGVCGEEMFLFWGWNFGECKHVPGVEYDDENGKGVAYAWVENGRLSEVSQVYDGSTPNAGHVKAYTMAEAGVIDARAIRSMERQLRMRLPGGYRHTQGIDLPYMTAPDGFTVNTVGVKPLTAMAIAPVDPADTQKGKARMAGKKIDPAARSEDADDENENADDLDTTDDVELTDDPAVGDDPEDVAADDADDQGDDAADDDDDDESADDAEVDDADGGEGANDAEDRVAMLKEVAREFKDDKITISMSERANYKMFRDAVVRLRADKRDLKKRAELGDRYIKDLLDRADTEGVRAFGGTHNKTMWRATLQTMIDAGNVDDAREIVDDFAAKAVARLGGGRKTREEAELAPDDNDGAIAQNVRQFPGTHDSADRFLGS